MAQTSPLSGADAQRQFRPGPVAIQYLAETTRFSLRISPGLAALAGTALGVVLPTKIGGRTVDAEKEVLCLGPDEWVLIVPEATQETLMSALATIYDTAPHSLVEIGDRDVSILLEGGQASELMSALCPRDLSQIPVGECRRTVFEGVSVVVTVLADDRYHLDVWRSFAPHLWTLLNHVNEELGIGL